MAQIAHQTMRTDAPSRDFSIGLLRPLFVVKQFQRGAMQIIVQAPMPVVHVGAATKQNCITQTAVAYVTLKRVYFGVNGRVISQKPIS
jgi:hypothetical protein